MKKLAFAVLLLTISVALFTQSLPREVRLARSQGSDQSMWTGIVDDMLVLHSFSEERDGDVYLGFTRAVVIDKQGNLAGNRVIELHFNYNLLNDGRIVMEYTYQMNFDLDFNFISEHDRFDRPMFYSFRMGTNNRNERYVEIDGNFFFQE